MLKLMAGAFSRKVRRPNVKPAGQTHMLLKALQTGELKRFDNQMKAEARRLARRSASVGKSEATGVIERSIERKMARNPQLAEEWENFQKKVQEHAARNSNK